MSLQKYYAKGRKKSGVMNRTETAYAQYLSHQSDVVWFKYEGITLRLAKKTSYTPDFFVLRANGDFEAHETKGAKSVFLDKSKVKIKIAADIYPLRFFVAFPNKGQWLIEEVA